MVKGLLPTVLGALSSVCLGAMVAPTPALAGKSCNYYNTNLFMAQGYVNQDGIWVSDGWWVIRPGDCVVYADNAFTYFKITDGQAPNRSRILATACTESINLCQINDRFTTYQADNGMVCGNNGGNMATFINPGSTVELIRSSH